MEPNKYKDIYQDLINIEKKQGFLTYSQVIDYTNDYSLTIDEFDRLCNSLMIKGVSIYDKDPFHRENIKNDRVTPDDLKNEDEIINLFEEFNVTYVDKRPNGGSLWIVGGEELSDIVEKAQSLGYNFHFLKKGGRATKKRPGWWTK